MATHFKWYGSNTEVQVPMNAVYTYPSQSNKTVKSTPRLTPKTTEPYGPGSEIRIDFPAQGYLNGGHTTLAFDVDLMYDPVAGDTSIIRFQNNVQSIFNRATVMYGSTPIEDIPEYGQLVRSMTEWTTTGDFDQGTISDGIGHSAIGLTGYVMQEAPEFDDTRVVQQHGRINVRQAYIQGISLQQGTAEGAQLQQPLLASDGFGIVPYTPAANIPGVGAPLTRAPIKVTRRYVVQLNLGLLLQGKLLPIKYMASQLSIVLRLGSNESCILWHQGKLYDRTEEAVADRVKSNSRIASQGPTYQLRNVVMLPEMLEFDSSYDQALLEGLQQGVPILFSSFNHFSFSTSKSTSQTLSITERNRSIKAIFTMQKRAKSDYDKDSGATFYTTGYNPIVGDNNLDDIGSTLQEYQYRIGGRYFPSSPVRCSLDISSQQSNGGAEAYVELAKALNTLGDYRLSTPCNVLSWATPVGQYYNSQSNKEYVLPEYDGAHDVIAHLPNGFQLLAQVESASKITAGTNDSVSMYGGRALSGMHSCCFAMAQSLETSNGAEISGLNAEEQADIEITMRWSLEQATGMQFVVYTYYDAMLVLMENNVIQLIK